jgi:hypothetical protein
VVNLNAKATEAIEQTKDSSLSAANTYFDFLQKTISSFSSGGTELGEKLKSYADRNIAATQEYLTRLGQAKDFQGVMRIQTEFMQSQMTAFGEQAKSLTEAFAKTAETVMKPPLKS